MIRNVLSVLRYCPPPPPTKVIAWAALPLLYFFLPADGMSFDDYHVSRLVAAVVLHLPFLLVVSLVNLLRHKGQRDRLVMASIVILSLLIAVNIDAILIVSNSATAAKHILSVLAGCLIAFHLWAFSFPDFLRDYYAWPWSGLPKGIGTAGVIRAFGHALVLLANEFLIPVLPDSVWVIAAALLPIVAILISDAVTVLVLYSMGLRPRGYKAPGSRA
ncbi:hypothetical protein [Ostreiculturibacter nitratireducens]|uniref:hypothetical protein n=1 Tax=Ostreiculturibacter nitratireducens TaxID=3075226 RepID=UPI0031B64A7E